MNIINSNRFRQRLRLSTDPNPHQQQPQNSTYHRPKSKIVPSLRYQNEPSLNKQDSTTRIHEMKSSKPATTSQIVCSNNPHSKPKRILFEEDEKRKKKRYLKLQLPKEITNSGELKTFTKFNLSRQKSSLDKQSNSSSDSMQLFKIRSILTIDSKKESHSRNSMNTLQDDKCSQEKNNKQYSKEKQVKLKIHEKGNRNSIQIDKNDIKDKIKSIENEYARLAANMKQIISEQLRRNNPQQLNNLFDRNIRAGCNIIFRTLKRKYTQNMQFLFWE